MASIQSALCGYRNCRLRPKGPHVRRGRSREALPLLRLTPPNHTNLYGVKCMRRVGSQTQHGLPHIHPKMGGTVGFALAKGLIRGLTRYPNPSSIILVSPQWYSGSWRPIRQEDPGPTWRHRVSLGWSPAAHRSRPDEPKNSTRKSPDSILSC